MLSKIAVPIITVVLFCSSLCGLSTLLAEGDESIFFQTHAAATAEDPGALIMRPIIPPGRPEWITDVTPSLDDSWLLVSAGPFKEQHDCDEQLLQLIKQKSDGWINEFLGSPMAASLLNYSPEELSKKLLRSDLQYRETVTVSLGPMQQLHAKLIFSDDFRKELKEKWHQLRQWSRLGQVGIFSVVLLALLGTMSGYFHWNNSTRGSQGANLQLASAAAILVIVVVGVTLARWIHWL